MKLCGIAWMMLAWAIVSSAQADTDFGNQKTQVDLELVLAVDVSFSIGVDERDVQRLAYIEAFRSSEIVQTMISGPYRRIAVTYVEWGEAGHQHVVIPWRLIASSADAIRFADDLESSPVHRSGATSISAALWFSARLFDENRFQSDRHMIDISGDGLNNDGEPVSTARDALDAMGITVNALPLASRDSDLPPEDLTAYYEACVETGSGSFTLPAVSSENFALAMRRKMISEIAGVTPRLTPRWSRARIWHAAVKKIDCLLGERKRRQEYIDMLRDLTNGRPERWQPDSKTWPEP